MAGTRRGKQGVSTAGIEKSPARRKREAKKRAAEERKWASMASEVKSIRLPTPTTLAAARGNACLGNPYTGMQSGECPNDATYAVAGDLPAGFVIAGVCDEHLMSVREAFREYGSDEPLVQGSEALKKEMAERVEIEFRDSVADAG